MSEDALNASIAAKWEAAGLNAEVDESEIMSEEDVTPVDNADDIIDTDPDAAAADDSDDSVTAADDSAVSDDAADAAKETNDGATDEVADAAQAVADAKTADEKQDAEDDLAVALGLGKPPEDPKQRAKWWKKQLPYSLVHKTVTEREKKMRETHDGVVKGHTDKIATYDTRFADVKQVETFIEKEHLPYLRTLAKMFPDTYGSILAPILGTNDAKAVLPKEVDLGPEPEPDYDLGDGTKTYSVDGLRKRDAWRDATLEQKLLKQFKPTLDHIEQQKTEAEQAAERKRNDEATEQRVKLGKETADAAVAEVKTWDLGEENIDAILAEAAKQPAHYSAELALNVAYRKIVNPKLKANRDTIRQELIAEGKKAAAKKTATAIATGQVVRTKEKPDADSLDVDTRIRNAWKRKGLI